LACMQGVQAGELVNSILPHAQGLYKIQRFVSEIALWPISYHRIYQVVAAMTADMQPEMQFESWLMAHILYTVNLLITATKARTELC